MHLRKIAIPALAVVCGFLARAHATLTLSSLVGANMVIQRDKAVPISGSASPGKLVTVNFNNQTKTTTSDSGGKWKITLDPMPVKATGGSLSATETGANTVTLDNIVVGDVWICSGQSNMDMSLGSCNRKTQDENTADYPMMRTFRAPLSFAGQPTATTTGSWTVCTPVTAGSFSAIAFYFGREVCDALNSAVPIGLYIASVGGTTIDLWLAPEGLTDVPELDPLFNQSILPNGPFSLFNGMIYPYSPLPAKGLLWYQGENAERTIQSPDSYYLKMKALAQGYKRLLGMDELPFYFVQLAYWGQQPAGPDPELQPGGGWSADTRLQQANAMAIPHSGMASAMDVGSSLDGDQIWDGWHPKTKQDVGERLALWALKNDYCQAIGETSGPILRNATVAGSTLVCTFDHTGTGLMVGSKTPYQPTTEVIGGSLDKFSIAGANGAWYDATASISGNTVVLSSPSVPNPAKAAYACWQNPVGANLYNKDGLPASPFYLDDVNAKFTITATAGAGGNISPAGTETYLKRHSTLYSITPEIGNYIQDVTVDGVSVGAVASYTFDPLYANHTITATFGPTKPHFTINASSSGGGSITPNSAVSVAQGDSQSFAVNAGPGVITNLTVDGNPMGQRDRFVFGDVRENHSISTTFQFPLTAQAGYGGTITPGGTALTPYGSNATYAIAPLTGFAISKVTVDGVNIGSVNSHTFTNITTSHTITATFTGTGGSGNIPQIEKLYTSFLTDNLPATGSITNWNSYLPTGKALTAIGSPTVEMIDGRKLVKNINTDGDGFDMGTVASPIPCTGATIVTVAKPVRLGADGNWYSIVDMFYDRLVLGIMNGSGRIVVRRNGSLDVSTSTIPDGQTTILSLVVQESGKYKVHANGLEVMNGTGTSAMTSIVPSVAGAFANHVSFGRNSPDSWTTYNGYYGDTFIYTTALSDAARQELETYLVNRLTEAGTNFTISATAGTGGSISPSGAVIVPDRDNQTFTITADSGYAISGVTVDGTGVGAVTTHTFNEVAANHIISATFIPTGNTPPTCSAIPDQNLSVNLSSATLGFTVVDTTTPAADLTVTASSSNQAVIPTNGIFLGGSGANRTVRVTPTTAATGMATVSLTVSDGELRTIVNFDVTVTAGASGNGVSFNVGLNGALASTDEGGVIVHSHWNNLTGSNNPSTASVKDSSGSIVPGMTATFQGNANTFNNTGVANQTMLSGFLTGNPMTVRFDNIPYAVYDVYVYYAGFNNGTSYPMIWEASNADGGSVLSTRYSVRGSLAGPQLFPTPGMVESNFNSLTEAQSQVAVGIGGNWLKFTGLTATKLIIAETSDSFFNENGFAGIQIINTSAQDGYARWIAGFPDVGESTGFREDADGDGFPNGVENFLGTNPSMADAAFVLTSTGDSTFKFRHSRSNHRASDTTAIYLWSTDLTEWRVSGESNSNGLIAEISDETVTDLEAPDNDLVEITVNLVTGTTDRMFARLECSKPL